VVVGVATGPGFISPVFEAGERLLVVELDGERELRRQAVSWSRMSPIERAELLQRLGVDLLICGGISRPNEQLIRGAGVELIPWVCGSTEEVLAAFKAGGLEQPTFRMPGCGRRRRARRGGCGRGRGRGRGCMPWS